MTPKIRQLQYIVAVADTGSFTLAAERCSVSQPGLSSQVRRLEQTLGVEIFERGAREVLPTTAGEEIIARARLVLNGIEDLVNVAGDRRDPLVGTVRLGVIPTIAPYLVPRIMPSLRARFPSLRLLIREEQTHELVEQVAGGALDLALAAVESDLGQLHVHPLFRDPFVVAVPDDHRLADRKRIRPGELDGEDVLLLEDGHCLRNQTAVICDTAGACELGDFRATSLITLMHMVAAGVGVTLLPEMAARGGAAAGLVIIPFTRPAPGRTVALAWRGSTPHRAQFEALAEVFADA